MPYGDVAYSDYNDTVSNGFKFKSNSDELSETDLTGFADVAYDGGYSKSQRKLQARDWIWKVRLLRQTNLIQSVTLWNLI